jgi:hypothetical protein
MTLDAKLRLKEHARKKIEVKVIPVQAAEALRVARG